MLICVCTCEGVYDFCNGEVRILEPGENLMSVKESGAGFKDSTKVIIRW